MKNVLVQIVQSLSDKEIRSLRAYYAAVQSDEGRSYNDDRLRLFELLRENEELNNDELAEILFGDSSAKPRLITLKSRLKRDILNIFRLLSGKEQYRSTRFVARYDVRQQIQEAEILVYRGMTSPAIEILKQARKKAKKYDLTLELIMIVELLQDHEGMQKSLPSYNRFEEEKVHLLEELREKHSAKRLFREATLPSFFSASAKGVNDAHHSVHLLRKLESSGSDEVRSYVLRAQTYLAFTEKDWDKARLFGDRFLALVSSSAAVKSRSALAGANMQLSLIELNSHQYKRAMSYALIAEEGFSKGSNNALAALSNAFLAALYLDDLQSASEISERAFRSRAMKRNNFQASIWSYYKAALEFLLDNYSDALATLQRKSQLLSDKKGYLIGYRLLELMCYVQLNLFDHADYRLDSLVKSLRTKDSSNPRMSLIVDYLRALISVKDTKAKRKGILESLEETPWDPSGYEIIRFERWARGYELQEKGRPV